MAAPDGLRAHQEPRCVPPSADVAVVSAPTTVLGPALAAGLVRRGWRTSVVEDERPTDEVLASAAVVVVDDDAGVPRVRPPLGAHLGTCVCVGSVSSLPVLRLLQRRGAAVVDRRAPFVVVLGAVELALLRAVRPGRADRIAGNPDLTASLERRQREHAALATLTPTEAEVLGAMLAGLGASEIGRLRHVALSTVRSHIRSVLAKLGVTTQLAAVAVARRSSDHPWPGEDPARFRSLADVVVESPHL